MTPRVLLATGCAFCAVLVSGSGSAPAAATYSSGTAGVPDGRVYEMVTPLNNKGAEVYQPRQVGLEYSGTETEYPFQAAASGNAVAYVAAPTVLGNESSSYDAGNEYVATRSPGGGWSQIDVSPLNAPSSVYQAFSRELSVGFLDAEEPLSPSAPGFGQEPGVDGNYDVLYSSGIGSDKYSPLFAAQPAHRSMAEFATAGAGISELTDPGESIKAPAYNGGTVGDRADNDRELAFAGASADDAHLLFEANDALTPAGNGRPAAEGGSSNGYAHENNLYESFDGQLYLVNVLPNGTTEANATFGGGSPYDHVINSEGSRVFWTDRATGHIYVRESGTTTVEVSPAGEYQTASADGSKVFFTNGDLYEYEVNPEVGAPGALVDLSNGVAVERVVGASENGDFVYYVTSTGEFVVWHKDATTTIPALPGNGAEVTPDGHSVVFEASGRVDVYDFDTGVLNCASCGWGGTEGELPLTNSGNVYQPRWISAEGSRVFFDSRAPLVRQDTNGQFDVYEWERAGSGGCVQSAGCIYLLSGGSSSAPSLFLDADESGDNVFIVSRAPLAPQDEGEEAHLYALYDARAGGVAPVAAPVCSGTGCQGVPGAPPIFATPSSVTFNGVGNFEATATAKGAVRKRRSAAQVRAEKLAKALKACHGRPRKRRAACEASARRAYGPRSKAKRSVEAGK
ncbi:MAG: hypothetical protein FWD42_06225 [Solirubrobacterales bacterium]|nr:hypothetical protein [Solirubrobacterales bacterium]